MGQLNDKVAEERILHLSINSEVSFDVMITPGSIKEFVYGNLYSEGFIRSLNELLEYHENEKKDLINVDVKIKDLNSKLSYLKKNYNIVWTECGSGSEIKRLGDQLKPLDIKIKIRAEDILLIPDKIKDKIDAFKQTGAFHYAFLFDDQLSLVTYSYDIGRHNAIDKVIGDELLNSEALDNKILYTTGRISSDLILKCARAKIPVVISRGAALDTAISLAKKYDLCLIGFLRGKRFNIYSHPEAVT
jgi:FdhD protein